MDIYTYLHNDHQKVDKLFQRISKSKDDEKKLQLFDQVSEELLLHMETEQQTFYAALEEQHSPPGKMQHAYKEHSEVKKLLARLKKLSVRGQKWAESFEALQEAVTHHVHEEETTLFSLAKETFTEQQVTEMTKTMRKLKREQQSDAK